MAKYLRRPSNLEAVIEVGQEMSEQHEIEEQKENRDTPRFKE